MGLFTGETPRERELLTQVRQVVDDWRRDGAKQVLMLVVKNESIASGQIRLGEPGGRRLAVPAGPVPA